MTTFSLTVPDVFAKKTVEVHRTAGAQWLHRLPDLIAELARDWRLQIGSPVGELSFNTGMAERAPRVVAKDPTFPTEWIERALTLNAQLSSSGPEPVILHGDLHHDNILAAQREPWLAIDAWGLVGDPACEPGPFLLNAAWEALDDSQAAGLLDRLVAVFGERLQLSPRRIRDWGACALSSPASGCSKTTGTAGSLPCAALGCWPTCMIRNSHKSHLEHKETKMNKTPHVDAIRTREQHVVDRLMQWAEEQPLVCTRGEVVEQLRALGVQPGMTLLVHTSFRAVRPVEDGFIGLIAALREALGPAGTLVMPTMTGSKATEPYDPLVTPTKDMGVVAETFWRLSGVLRSDHPTSSFAAAGPAAAYLTRPQPLSPVHGPASPVGWVHDLDGRVLLLGVGHTANTTIHLGEATAGVPYTVRKWATVLRDGRPQRVSFEEADHCCRRFALVEGWLQERDQQAEGRVGHARARLMRSRDVVKAVTDHLAADRTLFLCPTAAGCAECDRARAGIGRTAGRFPQESSERRGRLRGHLSNF
ncbi:MAG: AAC(3) family N-acetyltransferase [Chloroflexi bacterium]|nr:AAC(3) family N-acetyltransferase [Chloroflexota bacterium]